MNYNGITNNTRFRSKALEPFATTNRVFTPDEVDKIVAYTNTLELGKGLISTGDPSEVDLANAYRRSNVAFFGREEENSWIFKRLNSFVEDLNNSHYNFCLNGYDNLQYTEYNASYQGKYEWHTDCLLGSQIPDSMHEMRKLSFSMLLSEPGVDFEGGDFQVLVNSIEPTTVKATKGTVIFFPSFIMHRVSELTRGKRKSLVGWVTGPKFK